ncbi:VOC family protein [Promicromonospora soli]|uniref:VOC domain-containing protein n=1 Tax=Promicromonospora soli TaxID=2035533 RepID=A0A919KX58_9MICO|nr:VOC family protein [Promicromonospora soli]GHH75369.1 hypothetical protein GCM10017772_31540 [Promicromonospora soli]
MTTDSTPAVPSAPVGSNTVNPFIVTDDAAGLIAFLIATFEATEIAEARTADTDGLVLHSELRIGDSVVMIADRKPDWLYSPAFTQVYVTDVAATLRRAVAHGGRVVTDPTDFWGDVLARIADPFGNVWWVCRHNATNATWDDEPDAAVEAQEPGGADTEETWSSFITPELEYIHSTLLDTMAGLRDPRTT